MTQHYLWQVIHVCGMTPSFGEITQEADKWTSALAHSHVWHDSFTCVALLIYICGMAPSYDSFTRVTWQFYTCDMTLLYLWHDSLIWLIHIGNMKCGQIDLRTDSFTRVTWRAYMCDMTHLHLVHDFLIGVGNRRCGQIDLRTASSSLSTRGVWTHCNTLQ